MPSCDIPTITLGDIIEPSLPTRKEVHQEVYNQYRNFFREKWANLVFRRVGSVVAEETNFKSGCISRPHELPTYYRTLNEYVNAADEETLHKAGISVYKYWHAKTTCSVLRRESDKVGEVPIWFDIYGYCKFDMQKRFWFDARPKKVPFEAKRPPKIRKVGGTFTSDLVCGLVSTRDGFPVFTRWFICSEQFYKLWTMVMCEASEVYPRRNSPSQLLRRLRCNNVTLVEEKMMKKLKELREKREENPDDEEVDKEIKELYEGIIRHHEVHRTEGDSGNWPGIYQAFARFVVYDEKEEYINEKLLNEYNPDVMVEKREVYPQALFKNIISCVTI